MRSPWSIAALLVGAFLFAFGGYFVADSVTGPSAVVGDPGAQGPAGVDGADGRDGHDGVDGADGTDGSPGPRGVPGAPGATGATGAAGADGAPGPTGSPGIPGADGALGAQGPAGADGATGAQGPAGPAGADGPRSYAVIVNSPATVSAATVTLAEVAVTEGRWIVSAGWNGMTLVPDNSYNLYGCWLTHSQNVYMYQMVNSGPAIDSYSLTQVFSVPAEGSIMRLSCHANTGVALTFNQVTLSAVEVTG